MYPSLSQRQLGSMNCFISSESVCAVVLFSIHDLEFAFQPQLFDGEALKETHPRWMVGCVVRLVCKCLNLVIPGSAVFLS